MKNLTVCGDGFAELHSDELETIHGGEAPKLPIGITWKDIILFGIENFNDLKNGLIAGWSFPDKK